MKFGNLEVLWTLNLYNNELTGEIPVSIGKLTELRNFRFYLRIS